MVDIEKKDVYPFESGLSPVTSKLIDLLKKGQIGDILTDEEMTSHCGKDTRPNYKGYGNLQTAIKRVRKKVIKYGKGNAAQILLNALIPLKLPTC